MTYKTLTTNATCVIGLLFASVCVHAETRWAAPGIVEKNCSGCHGMDGNSDLSYFPRLAGLDASYAAKKVAEFKESPAPAVDQISHWIVASFKHKKENGNFTTAERTDMIGMAML